MGSGWQDDVVGKDEDGNDLPPLTSKQKAQKARELFVMRVQAYYSAARTELSQSASIKRTKVAGTRKVLPGKAQFVARSTKDEKPTLLQWYVLDAVRTRKASHAKTRCLPRL